MAWFVLLLVLLGEESGKSSAGGSCVAAVVRVCRLKAVLSWAWGLAPHVAGGLLAVLWELSWVVTWSISTWPLSPGELRLVRRLTDFLPEQASRESQAGPVSFLPPGPEADLHGTPLIRAVAGPHRLGGRRHTSSLSGRNGKEFVAIKKKTTIILTKY